MYKYDKFILENGVRLLVVPTDNEETVIYVAVKNGSQYERKHENGLSHFVEHYLFRGTRKLSDFREIGKFIRSIQGYTEAATDYEEVFYLIEAPSRHFKTSLDIISELLIFPTFKPEEVNIEQDVIIQEMGTWKDRPDEYLKGDLWPQLCFGDQPAGRPVYGTKDTIMSFTASNMESFFKRHYIGEGIIVVVAGSKDFLEYLPKIKEVFGEIKSGKARNSFPIKDNQKSPRYLISNRDTELTHLYLGAKTPFLSADKEGYAALISGGIINANLYFSMVGDRGLSYERHTGYYEDPTKSFLCTYAGITHSKTAETIRIILEEYRRIRELGVTNKELNEEIEICTNNLKRAFKEEPIWLATFFANNELYTNTTHSPEEELERFRSVTRGEIQEVARRTFRPENLNLAIRGPYKEDDKEFENIIKEILKRL